MLPISKTISHHKPCRTILDLFQFFLEAKSVRVPNLTSIFQDRPHQSFISCFIHIWGTRIQNSQESESSVCLCTNIGNMTIPFRIKEAIIMIKKPFGRVRSFTGMDRNGHNYRNGLPEWTICCGFGCFKCILSA